MAAVVIRFFDSLGAALTAQQILSAIAGTPGTALNIQIWNNKGGSGADDAINWRLAAGFRTKGDTHYLSAGHEFADQHFFEFRILGGLNGLSAAATGWLPVGANARVTLPVVGNDEGLDCEIRLAPGANAQDATGSSSVEIKLTPLGGPSEPISRGLTFASSAGVVVPMRNTSIIGLARAPAIVENSPVDNKTDVGDLEVLIDGQVFVQLQHDETHTNAAAGNERYDLLTVDSTGAVVITAGSEVAAPVTEGDKPAIPADEIPLAYVFVDENGTIVDADIDTSIQEPAFLQLTTSAASLTATVGGGVHAIVDDALITLQKPSNVTLTASSTNRIWLQRDGSFAVTQTAARPESGAMLLHVAVTDGSGVTSQEDHRAFIGFERFTALFNWPDDTVDQYQLLRAPHDRDLLLLPDSIQAMILTAGASGSCEFELEYYDGSWNSIFTAGDLPEILSSDGDNFSRRGFWPSTTVIPAGSLMRASVATAFASGSPANLALQLDFAI